METYSEMSRRHQEEYNAFAKDHVHYAFGKEQLKELLDKLGTTYEQLCADYRSIPGGGIIRRTDYPLLISLFDRQDKERKEMRKVGRYLYDMFYAAMADMEYVVTGDDEEVLNRCGISLKDFTTDKRYAKAYTKAKTDYMKSFDQNGDDLEEAME